MKVSSSRKDRSQRTFRLPITDRDLSRFLRRPALPDERQAEGFQSVNTSNSDWKGDARNQPISVSTAGFLSDKICGLPTRSKKP